MRRVALTGGIATGKSYVLARFSALGVPTLDADELAHGAMGPGTEGARAIADRFGASALAPDGSVNRRALGTIVFADPDARRDLEAIVHPAVYRSLSAGLRAFERLGGAPFAVADIPLLYETGRASDFDSVIATVCTRALQLERLVQRGLTRTEAEQRLAAQIPAEDKASRADHVIRTDGRLADTDAQVDAIFRALADQNPAS